MTLQPPRTPLQTAIVLMVGLMFFVRTSTGTTPSKNEKDILTGAMQVEEVIRITAGKRVGLFANHTALAGRAHVLDTLRSRGVNITRIYSPEHGFRGDADAGEEVAGSVDTKTGIPIISLYGPSKKPTAEQLSGVEVVLFDMQDIGARFFTYISSLHYMMEACARDNKLLVILDRPNPNGGYIDGPVLQKDFKSFVGMHPVPIVHGMTLGEYARMVNGEGWLDGGKPCQLEVVKVKGWKHGDHWPITVKPSPNLPNDHAIRLYPSTCLFEGTVLSIGRGTLSPFEQAGHPDLKGKFEYSFTPVSIPGMAKSPLLQDKVCYGLDFRKEPVTDGINLDLLIRAYQAFPAKDKFFNNYFDKLAGTKVLREQIISGMKAEEIRKTWKVDLDAFHKIRARYLLYP